MQVKKQVISDTRVKLTVIADQEFIDNVKSLVLRRIGDRDIKIPGFRAGKAPLNLIEKNIDSNALQQEFLEEAINRMYETAVKNENLRPIDQPKIDLKKFVPFTTVEFDAELTIIGDVKLANYKLIKKSLKPSKVSPKEINEVINSIKKSQATRNEVARPAKHGDELVIDFNGKDEKGQPVSGADGKDFPIVIGSNAFIPGFEDELIGLKAGANKTFTIKFPKDYGFIGLQNKKVSFDVAVKKVQELVEPIVDDGFASKAGPFKKLGEMRADIKKHLKAEKDAQASKILKNELVQEIVNKSSVAIPDVIIDAQSEEAEKVFKNNLVARGQTWQEYLKSEKLTETEYRKRQRPIAVQNVKTSLILTEIAKLEAIIVTKDEVENQISLLKQRYTDKAMQAELDKPENQRDIEGRLMADKTVNKLLAYVTNKVAK